VIRRPRNDSGARGRTRTKAEGGWPEELPAERLAATATAAALVEEEAVAAAVVAVGEEAAAEGEGVVEAETRSSQPTALRS
jgi:hypothetical protein